MSANKKFSWKNQTFPSLFWSKKLVMALEAAVVVMGIVAVIDIEIVMAIVTFLAIKTVIHLSGIAIGIKCKKFVAR